MKKINMFITSFILVVSIVLQNISFAFASTSKVDNFVNSTQIVESDGSVSTIYTYADFDTYKYRISNTFNNKVTEIKNNNGLISIYENGVFIKNIDTNEEINKNLIATRAWSSWAYSNTQKGHISLWRGIAMSVAITIIASALNLPAGLALIANFAGTIINDNLSDCYYIRNNYYRFDFPANNMQGKSEISLYKWSNYTGLISSATHYGPVTSMDNGWFYEIYIKIWTSYIIYCDFHHIYFNLSRLTKIRTYFSCYSYSYRSYNSF